MTKYFIPIYKTSIRVNPNAGMQDFVMHTGDDITVKGILVGDIELDKQPPGLKALGAWITEATRESGARVANITMKMDRLPIDTGTPNFMEELNKLFAPWGIAIKEINIDRHMQPFHTITPESDYLYDYMPIKVICDHCGSTFQHDELLSDYGAFDNNACTNTKCPKCDAWDCCEVEYEDIKKLNCEEIIKQYAKS